MTSILMRTALLASSAIVCSVAMPAQAQVRHFDVSAQRAETAIAAIGKQADIQIIAARKVTRGKRINGVHGDLTVSQALYQLLSGTGLSAHQTGPQTYAIIPAVTTASAMLMPAARNDGNPMMMPVSTRPMVMNDAPVAASQMEAAPQSDDVAENAGKNIEDIVVTGSRLQNSGFLAPSPVTVLGTANIQQRAPANIADLLNETPAFRSQQNDTRRTGSNTQNSVQSLIDLRGLGDQRTLVLIDGHRVVATNPRGTVDTNLIPVGVIERVEVVTGGASAAYGSDAVAGVANFIMRDKMEGISGSIQGGITDKGDGKQRTATFAAGTSFADNRLHVVIGADYNKSDAIEAYTRKTGQSEIATITPSAAQRTALGLPASVISANVEPGTAAIGGLYQQSPGVAYTFDQNGNPVPFAQGTLYATNMVGSTANYGYNVNNVTPLRSPTSRLVGYAHVAYDITDNLEVYGEVNLSHQRIYPYSTQDYLSIGGNLPPLNILRTNPYVTAATLALIPATATSFNIGRINSDLEGNIVQQKSNIRRFVGGISGTIFDNWKFDAYYQHGRTTQYFRTTGLVAAAFQKAVNGCATSNLTASQLATIAIYESTTGKTCLGFNPFGTGRNTEAQADYFQNDQTQTIYYGQDVAAASISGSPIELPAGPLTVATGIEHRQDKIRLVGDPLTGLGYIYSAANFVAFSGKQKVTEGFLEVGVPLLKDAPFAHALDLNGAVRRTHYLTSGSVTTWKVGATWEPIEALRLRFTRSRDIRAPSLQDLYMIGGLTTGNVVNNIPNGTVGANGSVNVNPLGSSNTVSQVTGVSGGNGNAALVPEVANTYTGGIVLQLGRFRASADYYHVKVSGAIAALSVQQTADQCRDGVAALCANITFDATQLSGISLIKTRPSNFQTLVVSGYDFEVAYRMPMLFDWDGSLNVRALVNYTTHNSSYSPLTGITTESVNTLDQIPKFAYNVTLGYESERFTFNLQFRGFAERRGNPRLYGTNTTILGPEDAGYSVTSNYSISKNRYPAVVYVNPSVSVNVTKNVTLFANIDNLFNVDAPDLVISPAYDLIGRRYRAGVRFKM